MAEIDLLENLNEAQKKAVITTEGYIRVIAGAGSGKTRALTNRFAYLVNELGVSPGNIMCVTFTNKAAQEMKRRIHKLTGDKDTAYINTFHGFCVSVLSEESFAVHFPKSFLVLDNSDINSMLDIVYEERGLTSRDMTYSNARDMIEIQKILRRPEYYKDLINMSLEDLHEKYLRAEGAQDIIFFGYLYQQKKCFGLDYNDLIIFTLHIFEENEDICLKWQKRLQYIMIDEFQDIDSLQYRLMDVLRKYNKNLFVVGDPDQTIYTWRGADVRYLLEFEKNFPGTVTIMMNDNYRSTPEIVSTANSLISMNRFRVDKNLTAHQENGNKTIYHHALNAAEEADWIYDRISGLMEKGVKPGDNCILVRAHYLTANLEKKFIEKKLPYRIYSGVQFFERAEIKNALSYLRLIAMRDDLSFIRVVNTPKRNMGKSRMEYLKLLAEAEKDTLYNTLVRHLEDDKMKGTKAAEFVRLIEEMSEIADNMLVSELMTKVLDKSGYEKVLRVEGDQERLDNLAELKQLIYEYETTCGEEADLVHFLEHVALYTNLDEPDASEKVKIMTIHAAKGLEFPYVYVCGMSEGVFPSKKARTLQALEEERRLCFVAYTRAVKGLYLSDAEGAANLGFRYPSRFILELEENVLEYDVPLEDDILKGARLEIKCQERILEEKEKPSVQISVGTVVNHKVFGPGEVLGTDEDTQFLIVKFKNIETPRNISLDKLEIVVQ